MKLGAPFRWGLGQFSAPPNGLVAWVEAQGLHLIWAQCQKFFFRETPIQIYTFKPRDTFGRISILRKLPTVPINVYEIT